MFKKGMQTYKWLQRSDFNKYRAVSENFSFTDQIRNVGHNIVIAFNSTFEFTGTIWGFLNNETIAKPAVLSKISSLVWECYTINCTRASSSTVNWSAFIYKISLQAETFFLNWLQDRNKRFSVLNSRTEIPGIGPGTTESPLFFINRVFSQISTLSFGSFFVLFYISLKLW